MVWSVFDGTVCFGITAGSNKSRFVDNAADKTLPAALHTCPHQQKDTPAQCKPGTPRLIHSLQRYGSDKAEIAPHVFVFGI
jgi:hypothetical protein